MPANLVRACWSLFLIAGAAAQSPTFSADVKVVNLLATVRDRNGAIVKNLTKDDFVVEEDGRPQTIRYFSRESDLPLTVGLLVDTSWSQRNIIEEERGASLVFLARVLRDGKDRASVVSFDTGVHLYQRTTGSREQIAAALLELESPKEQATLLYDAVAVASEGLMRKEQGRKAFMLISDGLDYGSKASISLAIEYAQRADVLIYSILFADTVSGYGPAMSEQQAFMNRALGSKVMRRLSRETGAGFFEVSKSKPVEKIYDEIAEELRNQYSIGYTPDRSSSNGAFRKIKLTVKGKGLIVRTREGYYP